MIRGYVRYFLSKNVKARKKILVIDDDRVIRRLLFSCLRKQGFKVIIAKDGRKGLKKVRQLLPDLVILDLMLPKLPGEEVCREIRRDQNNVPIIMLTGKDKDVDRVVGKVIGANSYITKPFDLPKLMEEVDSLIGEHR
ncbi:MAG: response regulator [Candidatus Omnitrophica bacterium]|nr:response regulator [Candidatus Omnitrophota bacterium]